MLLFPLFMNAFIYIYNSFHISARWMGNREKSIHTVWAIRQDVESHFESWNGFCSWSHVGYYWKLETDMWCIGSLTWGFSVWISQMSCFSFLWDKKLNSPSKMKINTCLKKIVYMPNWRTASSSLYAVGWAQ